MPEIARKLSDSINVDDRVYYAGEPFEDIKTGDIGIVCELDDTIFEGYLVEFPAAPVPFVPEGFQPLPRRYWLPMELIDHLPKGA